MHEIVRKRVRTEYGRELLICLFCVDGGCVGCRRSSPRVPGRHQSTEFIPEGDTWMTWRSSRLKARDEVMATPHRPP